MFPIGTGFCTLGAHNLILQAGELAVLVYTDEAEAVGLNTPGKQRRAACEHDRCHSQVDRIEGAGIEELADEIASADKPDISVARCVPHPVEFV